MPKGNKISEGTLCICQKKCWHAEKLWEVGEKWDWAFGTPSKHFKPYASIEEAMDDKPEDVLKREFPEMGADIHRMTDEDIRGHISKKYGVNVHPNATRKTLLTRLRSFQLSAIKDAADANE